MFDEVRLDIRQSFVYSPTDKYVFPDSLVSDMQQWMKMHGAAGLIDVKQLMYVHWVPDKMALSFVTAPEPKKVTWQKFQMEGRIISLPPGNWKCNGENRMTDGMMHLSYNLKFDQRQLAC